jgi:hypothetical protein
MKGPGTCPSAIFFLIAISHLACSAGNEPSQSYYITLWNGNVTTLDSSATVTAFAHMIDGVIMVQQDFDSIHIAQVGVYARYNGASPGHHEYQFKIIKQTHSPTSYHASGIHASLSYYISQSPGYVVASEAVLPDKTASLATGEILTIPFDL